MRAIDADTLKGEFTGNFVDAYPTALVHTLIDSAPTIDAVPVVHGKWEFWMENDNGNVYYCSNCEYVTCEQSNYCPLCGAKNGR